MIIVCVFTICFKFETEFFKQNILISRKKLHIRLISLSFLPAKLVWTKISKLDILYMPNEDTIDLTRTKKQEKKENKTYERREICIK